MRRKEMIKQLKQGATYDLLIIGGGATGCGIAVDAASRGLKTALIEKNDFSEGTSSRSTKLVHGGVRYLEMAVKHLDQAQYNLVKEGLHERGVLLQNAPHLSNRLPLVTPLYKLIEIPYIFAGLKLYDVLAGKMGIGHSRLLSRSEALRRFPMLNADGLKAGVLYYDGQFNDARMAVSLAVTAREHGAAVANHLEVIGLNKNNGTICGAEVRDHLSGESWKINAHCVINATGPFADNIRKLDVPGSAPILKASSGIHIVLDKRFAPPETGLMIPKTEDGRVLFILPWHGHTLVGTTDDPAEITDHPKAKDEEIDYLLRHVGQYFNLQVSKTDIKSVWSGLRPLVFDPKAADTSKLVRDHLIMDSDSRLVTIAGGKWTSYRKMAEDVVDHAIKNFGFKPPRTCQTNRLRVAGGAAYSQNGDQQLVKEFGLSADIAKHLNGSYGDRASIIAKIAADGFGERLHPDHPYIEAEVIYTASYEFAERASDVLTRRTALALLDIPAAAKASARVIELMTPILGWDESRCLEEARLVEQRLTVAI
jgi:glycerol-3-phosphate dehydrogenase